VWVVACGDFFSVALVHVHVWRQILDEVGVCGCGDYGFAAVACEFLQVESHDFGGVAVQCACELVEEPELRWRFCEACDMVAVFLSVAELLVAAEEEEGVV
jgi:hypothetical protein